MMRRTKISSIGLILLLASCGGFLAAEDLTGREIMDRVDDNQFIDSARYESRMVIYDRGRENQKEMITFARSDGDVTNALAEFTNPRDRGTKYLLEDDELWMYFPDAEDLVRISGHMLEQRMMGSDFSYQDLLESEKLTELYEFEKTGEETVDGRPTYVIEATAREDQTPAYYRRKFWVDQERFVLLREEMFARDGRLLKEMVTRRVEEVQPGRWYPMEMIMEDKLRQDTRTRFEITEIDLDYDIPEGKISLRSLQ